MSAENVPEQKKETLEAQPQDKEAINSQNTNSKEDPVNIKKIEIKEKNEKTNPVDAKKIERLKRFGLTEKEEKDKSNNTNLNLDTNKKNINKEVPDITDEVLKQRRERFKDEIEEEEKEKKGGKTIEGSKGRIMKYNNKNIGRGFRNYSGGRDRRRDRGYDRDRYQPHRIRGGRRNGGYRK